MKKFNETEVQEIIDDYKSGLSSVEIGKKFGVNTSRILYILHLYGIEIRPRKGLKHCTHSKRTVSLDIWTSQEGTPNFDYFIGILASDGCIVNTQVALELAENNKQILDDYNTFLNGVCNINSRYCKKRQNTYYNIKYKNEDIVKFLAGFGIVPRKSNILKLKYINWNVLRGIFDGDGSIIQDPRCNCSFKFKITSGSVDFIDQLKEFYRVNGIHFYIEECLGKKDSYWYNIIVGRSEDIYKIYYNMYKDSSFCLQRKKDKFGPLVEKFTKCISVNSVNERENSKTEPSFDEEGAETRNREPKLE
jgi:hypothetical protein